MNVSIELDDRAVNAALAKLVAAGGKLKPALRDIGDMMVSRITEGFDQTESPYGKKWQELKPETKVNRLRHNKSNFNKSGKISARGRREAIAGFSPLTDTGKLRNSITRNVSANSVDVGTGLIYATTQQFGSEDGTIPARPFMPMDGLPDDWAQEVLGSISKQLIKAMR